MLEVGGATVLRTPPPSSRALGWCCNRPDGPKPLVRRSRARAGRCRASYVVWCCSSWAGPGLAVGRVGPAGTAASPLCTSELFARAPGLRAQLDGESARGSAAWRDDQVPCPFEDAADGGRRDLRRGAVWRSHPAVHASSSFFFVLGPRLKGFVTRMSYKQPLGDPGG